MDEQPRKKIMSDMTVRFAPLPRGAVERRPRARLGGDTQTEILNNKSQNTNFVADEFDTPPARRASPPPLGRGGTEHYGERSPHKGRFLWVIAAMCIIALALGIGGLFAHAKISITPKTFSGTVNTTISFSQGQDANVVFFGTATKTFSDEIIVAPTGSVAKEAKASGKIRFYNSNTSAKKIPAGTKLVSSKNIQYQTTKAVTVPAKKGTTPGQIDIGIVAVMAGSDGNTDLDDFIFVTAKSFANITAKSFAPIIGGAQGTDSIGDPAEIAAAGETLRTRFADPAVLTKRIAETIPENFIVLPISITPSTPTITTETNHTDGVHVIAKQTVGIIVVKKEEIARALGNQLKAEKDMLLTMQNFDGLTMITGTAISASSIPAQFSARITGTTTITGSIDREILRNQMVGISKSDAKKILTENPATQSFRLRMRPFWRRTMPISENDIVID